MKILVPLGRLIHVRIYFSQRYIQIHIQTIFVSNVIVSTNCNTKNKWKRGIRIFMQRQQ